MRALKPVLAVAVGILLVIGICTALPPQTRTQPANASQGAEITETCPPPTADGVYFPRGYDKSTNELVCGFSFYNACPYSEAVSATDPLCEKAKPTEAQLAPWNPNETTTTETPAVDQCTKK